MKLSTESFQRALEVALDGLKREAHGKGVIAYRFEEPGLWTVSCEFTSRSGKSVFKLPLIAR